MKRYSVRYVHAISPSDRDVGPEVRLTDADAVDRKSLAAALRARGTMLPGARIRSYRVEDGKVVVFPSMPGMTTYWHSIVLTPLPDPDLRVSNCGSFYVVAPASTAGGKWVTKHLVHEETVWCSGGVVVEGRYVDDIAAGASADGLEVARG